MKAVFKVECKGRDSERKEVLEESVKAEVEIQQTVGTNSISINVNCEYNCGGHGQRCSASGDDRVLCAYSIDLPYAMDNSSFSKYY